MIYVWMNLAERHFLRDYMALWDWVSFHFWETEANDQRKTEMSNSLIQVSILLARISAHWCTNLLHNHPDSRNNVSDQELTFFNKPAKCIGILEIHYHKSFQVEAPTFKALPSAIWKFHYSKKDSFVTGSMEWKCSNQIIRWSSLLGQVTWGTTSHNPKERKFKTW